MNHMLICVAGTPGSGKTVIAEALFEKIRQEYPKKQFAIVHTDEVRARMRAEDKNKDNPIIHTSFLEANKLSDAPGMAGYWEGWIKQSEAIMPEVAKEVKQLLEQGKSVICEGVAMIPPYGKYFPKGLEIMHFNINVGDSDTNKKRLQSRGRIGDRASASDLAKIKNIHIVQAFQDFLKTCSDALEDSDLFMQGLIAAAQTPISFQKTIKSNEAASYHKPL